MAQTLSPEQERELLLTTLQGYWAAHPSKVVADFYALEALDLVYTDPEDPEPVLDPQHLSIAVTDRQLVRTLEALRAACRQHYLNQLRRDIPYIVCAELRHIYDVWGVADKPAWFKDHGDEWYLWYCAFTVAYWGENSKIVPDDAPPAAKAAKKASKPPPPLPPGGYGDAYRAALGAQKVAGIKPWEAGELVFPKKWGGSYGGPKWALISRTCRELMEATTLEEAVPIMDFANSLQHNTQSMFDKCGFYNLPELRRALDIKFTATSPRVVVANASALLQQWFTSAWPLDMEVGLSAEEHALTSKKLKAVADTAEGGTLNPEELKPCTMFKGTFPGWKPNESFTVESVAPKLRVIFVRAHHGIQKKVDADQPNVCVSHTGFTFEQVEKCGTTIKLGYTGSNKLASAAMQTLASQGAVPEGDDVEAVRLAVITAIAQGIASTFPTLYLGSVHAGTSEEGLTASRVRTILEGVGSLRFFVTAQKKPTPQGAVEVKMWTTLQKKQGGQNKNIGSTAPSSCSWTTSHGTTKKVPKGKKSPFTSQHKVNAAAVELVTAIITSLLVAPPAS